MSGGDTKPCPDCKQGEAASEERCPNGCKPPCVCKPHPEPMDFSDRLPAPPEAASVWQERVKEVVDQAHDENWGGKHREGFCEACADAYLVAQYAVPGGPSHDTPLPADQERCGGRGYVRRCVDPEYATDALVQCPGCPDCKHPPA